MNKRYSVALLALAFTAPVWSHGDSDANAPAAAVMKEQKLWGIAGDAKGVDRTIEIRMLDAMTFEPRQVEVREGEIVRFIVRNHGQLRHEMVIGTTKELDEHAAMMAKFPGMQHDEPYLTHVAPSKRGEIVWNFNRPGQFQFACLVDGHYQAGMYGTLTVTPAQR